MKSTRINQHPTRPMKISSDNAPLTDVAQSIFANTPDIREEKVNALRRAIAGGTYHVPAVTLAGDILAEEGLTKRTTK